jgi:hypothetical protein
MIGWEAGTVSQLVADSRVMSRLTHTPSALLQVLHRSQGHHRID